MHLVRSFRNKITMWLSFHVMSHQLISASRTSNLEYWKISRLPKMRWGKKHNKAVKKKTIQCTNISTPIVFSSKSNRPVWHNNSDYSIIKPQLSNINDTPKVTLQFKYAKPSKSSTRVCNLAESTIPKCQSLTKSKIKLLHKTVNVLLCPIHKS